MQVYTCMYLIYKVLCGISIRILYNVICTGICMGIIWNIYTHTHTYIKKTNTFDVQRELKCLLIGRDLIASNWK